MVLRVPRMEQSSHVSLITLADRMRAATARIMDTTTMETMETLRAMARGHQRGKAYHP